MGYSSISAMTKSKSLEILESRLNECLPVVQQVLDNPLKIKSSLSKYSTHFVVTGIGSSEAHARFFVHLINTYSNLFAEFKYLSVFSESQFRSSHEKTLVVFSQGLSPNSQLALGHHRQFRHTILFTSVQVAEPSKSRGTEKSSILRELAESGSEIVYMPVREEKSTLIRIIGPLIGYLVGIQFVDMLCPQCLPKCSTSHLMSHLRNAVSHLREEDILNLLSDGNKGVYILCNSPFSEFSQNLAYKILEGLYWRMPSVWDYLQFSHGPFQQWKTTNTNLM